MVRTDGPWLDPELAVALEAIPHHERPQATIDPDRIEGARARLRRAVELPDGRPVRSEAVRIVRADNTFLDLRLHRPAGEARRSSAPGGPVLVWLHGGGYLLGSAPSDPRVEQEYADRVGCAVVGVDYRTAPEHPHPAPLEDVLLTLAWLRDGGGGGGGAPSWVALGGESAGAGLAAATVLAAKDIDFQLLVAPMLDDRTDEATSPAVDALGLWSGELNRRAWALYQRPEASSAPLASAARAAALDGSPPAYLDVGSADLFCRETVAYAQRLDQHGVPVELHVWPGAYHGFYEVAPTAAVSLAAKAARVRALRRALRRAGD
ncbi:alpha/beta hydrolase [Nocardioides sp. LHD-245]|uniref:alpha/beta hydrolase n=1 Tax=Nocardioides sp. LHD-245 TaxID=3051387 RepID=UPI0027E01A87|nr:alpha/beta hydrolase [Nocardioides sp. LHD-245]